MKRVQFNNIINDLTKKMVILAGPRQAGKTTLAKAVMEQYKNPVYLNYDQPTHREILTQQNWNPNADLLVLDELHKMPEWKNYLKGLYDTKNENQHLLVTGSARLEVFNQVGDSLAGRYFLHRLLPFSMAELTQLHQKPNLEKLITQGNFPEPYLATPLDAERWRLQYVDSLIRTDVLDFENIHDLRAIQTVFELLRHRVGSPVSYKSISENVGISPNTVKKYIAILEALYIVFRVTPFHKNIARSLTKEPKIYFYDTALVAGDKGILVENLTAVSLLKHCFGLRDYQAKDMRLHYLRTKDQQEVDFVLTLNEKIEEAIEVKLSDTRVSKILQWFVERYGFKASQVAYTNKPEYTHGLISVLQLEKYLASLYL